MRRVMFSATIGTVFVLLGADVAVSQTNAEINAGLQFNLSNPGARSLGLAGAFTALADDATAAFSNPAGLTNLTRPEISVEGRNWDYTNQFLDRGNASGTASGTGFDSVSGLQFGEASDSTSGLSFGSFVYPSSRWAVAIYHHQLANFKNSYRSSGPFFGSGGPRLFPVDAALDFEVTNLGGSLAFKLGPSLSIGLGASSYNYDGSARTTRYQVTDFYAAPDYSANRVLVDLRNDGDDDDIGFNAGFIWKPADRVSIGGVYRQGPQFGLDISSVLGPGHPAYPQPSNLFTGQFSVPDVYGVGIAVRPAEPFTVSFDWNRVLYSQLTDGFVDLINRPQYADDFEVDDADELRLGVQYIFAQMKYPLAIRAGAWQDPDHRVRYTGTALTTDADYIEKRSFEILFQPGDDQMHYTGGIGLVFGSHLQLDAGYDHSDLVDTGSLSLVTRF